MANTNGTVITLSSVYAELVCVCLILTNNSFPFISLSIAHSVYEMICMLSSFQEEVLRMICDVGKEGKLGGCQINTLGFKGIWKSLTENVNTMVVNLTGQVNDDSFPLSAEVLFSNDLVYNR